MLKIKGMDGRVVARERFNEDVAQETEKIRTSAVNVN